jgi:hypothetical protein
VFGRASPTWITFGLRSGVGQERAAGDTFLPVNEEAEKAVWAWKKASPDLDEEEDLPAELGELQDKRVHDVQLALKNQMDGVSGGYTWGCYRRSPKSSATC